MLLAPRALAHSVAPTTYAPRPHESLFLGFPLAAIRSANAAKSGLYRRPTPATTYKIARTLRRPPRTARLPSRFPLSCASGATPANFDTALFDSVLISGRSANNRATVSPATLPPPFVPPLL